MKAKNAMPRGFARETFILRLWQESAIPSGWRAQVQHVRTGEAMIFTDPQALLEYLQTQLAETDQPATLAAAGKGIR